MPAQRGDSAARLSRPSLADETEQLLINTARGGLIDEVALRAALDSGVLAGAALDVLSSEPPAPDNPLLGAKHCIITPHVAWTSLAARQRLLATTVENVRSILAGRPIHVVNPEYAAAAGQTRRIATDCRRVPRILFELVSARARSAAAPDFTNLRHHRRRPSRGALARRLGQPAVIAEVIAGILLGPSLLGRVLPGTFLHLFPKASMPGLSLLSQVGLVFFMFLIGLELDPKLLRGRGKTSFSISAAGICLPFALGALLAVKIFSTQAEPGVPLISFVLFMGIAMSITAFPVLARILAERNLIRTELGSIALACAAADDVTAWCLLAMVVSVVHASGMGAALLTTLEAAGFAGGMLFLVRPLLARLGARVSTRENLTQNVVALTFVLPLGLCVHDRVDRHSRPVRRVPVRHDHAAPGATTRTPWPSAWRTSSSSRYCHCFLRTAVCAPSSAWCRGTGDWLLCLALIAVACAGKFGGSFAVARISGMTTRDSAALGVLMNTRGLMELIVLNVGLDLGVISAKIFTMMVIMALVTTIMTTPLLQLLSPRSFQRPSLPEAESAAARPVRLLLCVGDARVGQAMALLAAACVGRARPSGSAALHLERPRDRTSGYLGPGANSGESRPSGLLPTFEAATRAELALEFISFDSADPAGDICEIRAREAYRLYRARPAPPGARSKSVGGTVGRVLAESPTAVALLVDRGLPSAFEPGSTGVKSKRVIALLCGGSNDSSALQFVEHLLWTKRYRCRSRSSVRPLADGPLSERAQALVAKAAGRAVLQYEPRAAQQALAALASEADLLVLGLDSTWGLRVDGVEARAMRLLGESPASLLVVQAGRSR